MSDTHDSTTRSPDDIEAEYVRSFIELGYTRWHALLSARTYRVYHELQRGIVLGHADPGNMDDPIRALCCHIASLQLRLEALEAQSEGGAS